MKQAQAVGLANCVTPIEYSFIVFSEVKIPKYAMWSGHSIRIIPYESPYRFLVNSRFHRATVCYTTNRGPLIFVDLIKTGELTGRTNLEERVIVTLLVKVRCYHKKSSRKFAFWKAPGEDFSGVVKVALNALAKEHSYNMDSAYATRIRTWKPKPSEVKRALELLKLRKNIKTPPHSC